MRRSVEFIRWAVRRGHLAAADEARLISAFAASQAPRVDLWLEFGGHLHADAINDIQARFSRARFICMSCEDVFSGARLQGEILHCPACDSTALAREDEDAALSAEIDIRALAAMPQVMELLPASLGTMVDAVPAEPATEMEPDPVDATPVSPAIDAADAVVEPLDASVAPADAMPPPATPVGASDESTSAPAPAPAPGARRTTTRIVRPSAVPAPAPTESPFQPGVVLGGQWHLIAQIGSTSVVDFWRAQHDVLQKPALVRVLRRKGPALAERFRREARACARLNHPAVVRVYDMFEHADCLCLVGEWVEGESADRHLDRNGALPMGLAVQAALSCADALAEAHAEGILHRDLRPGSLTVTPEGSVRLGDFGLARVGDDLAVRLTAPGTLLGVPAYLAPEVLAGGDATPAADVHALGATLYHLLTGVRPATTGRDNERKTQMLLRDRRHGVPPELEELVTRMRSPVPETRPTMTAVADALRAIDERLGEEEGLLPVPEKAAQDVHLLTLPPRVAPPEISRLEELVRQARLHPPVRVLLDCSECESITPTALMSMAELLTVLGDDEKVLMVGLAERVRIAMQMTGVENTFTVATDLETGLAQLGGGNVVWAMVEAA